MSELVHNPLKTMSIEELRKKIRLTTDPIVRFACLREQLERIGAETFGNWGCNGGQVMEKNRLTWPN